MSTVAVIITDHEHTGVDPICLGEVRSQTDKVGAEERYSFSVFMNNDGIEGLQGTWESAFAEGFDFYLFVDADLQLSENAFEVFLENSEFLRHKAIIAGSVTRKATLVYGGRTRRGKIVDPNHVIPMPCHLFDFNLVLVPKDAIEALDSPQDLFHRGILDYGYGEKAASASVPRVVAPGILAKTSREMGVSDWKNPEYSFARRVSSLLNAAGREIVRAFRG